PGLRAKGLDLHDGPRIDALGKLSAEERVHAARDDDRIERRIRDESIHAARGQELHPLAVLHRANPWARELAIEVTGERIERLVVVIVRVDGFEIHSSLLRS